MSGYYTFSDLQNSWCNRAVVGNELHFRLARSIFPDSDRWVFGVDPTHAYIYGLLKEKSVLHLWIFNLKSHTEAWSRIDHPWDKAPSFMSHLWIDAFMGRMAVATVKDSRSIDLLITEENRPFNYERWEVPMLLNGNHYYIRFSPERMRAGYQIPLYFGDSTSLCVLDPNPPGYAQISDSVVLPWWKLLPLSTWSGITQQSLCPLREYDPAKWNIMSESGHFECSLQNPLAELKVPPRQEFRINLIGWTRFGAPISHHNGTLEIHKIQDGLYMHSFARFPKECRKYKLLYFCESAWGSYAGIFQMESGTLGLRIYALP